MIKLRWAPFPESKIDSYKVYRSIIGFSAPLVDPAVLDGLTLELRVNDGPVQTVTFDGTTPVVGKLNQSLIGCSSYASALDTERLILRANVREENTKLEIVGGTALDELGLGLRVITEKSEDELIATVPALVDPTQFVEFEDPDGILIDWYAVSTVGLLGAESMKTEYRQPVTAGGKVCVIEGLVVNLQGVRMVDVEVKATLVQFPHSPGQASHITVEPIVTRSGPDGRFSMPLLQGAIVQLDIPDVSYSRNIRVPEKPYAFITELGVDTDYQFPLRSEV